MNWGGGRAWGQVFGRGKYIAGDPEEGDFWGTLQKGLLCWVTSKDCFRQCSYYMLQRTLGSLLATEPLADLTAAEG